MAESITVDNANSRIRYSSGWNPGNEHTTTASGSTATFQWIGNKVSVVGAIPQGSGQEVRVEFAIDGRAPTTITRRTGGSRAGGEVYFDSGWLSTYSPHRLVVTFRGGPQFPLEAIRYEGAPGPEDDTPPPTQAPPPPNTTSIPPSSSPATSTPEERPTTTTPRSSDSSSSSTPASSDTDSNTPPPSTTDTPAVTTKTEIVNAPTDAPPPGSEDSTTRLDATGAKSAVPTGAIIGAVVGSILFILLIVLIVILLRKRRKRAIALADVSLRDDVNMQGMYGGGGDYATSATGLVNFNHNVAPPVYTPPQSQEYVPAPITKRRPSFGSGNNADPYARSYTPASQDQMGQSSGGPAYNMAGQGAAGPSGSSYPYQHQYHQQPQQQLLDVSDNSTVSGYSGSAYSGMAGQEQTQLAYYGHQQHPSVSVSESSAGRGAGGSAGPAPAVGTGVDESPPAYVTGRI